MWNDDNSKNTHQHIWRHNPGNMQIFISRERLNTCVNISCWKNRSSKSLPLTGLYSQIFIVDMSHHFLFIGGTCYVRSSDESKRERSHLEYFSGSKDDIDFKGVIQPRLNIFAFYWKQGVDLYSWTRVCGGCIPSNLLNIKTYNGISGFGPSKTSEGDLNYLVKNLETLKDSGRPSKAWGSGHIWEDPPGPHWIISVG